MIMLPPADNLSTSLVYVLLCSVHTSIEKEHQFEKATFPSEISGSTGTRTEVKVTFSWLFSLNMITHNMLWKFQWCWGFSLFPMFCKQVFITNSRTKIEQGTEKDEKGNPRMLGSALGPAPKSPLNISSRAGRSKKKPLNMIIKLLFSSCHLKATCRKCEVFRKNQFQEIHTTPAQQAGGYKTSLLLQTITTNFTPSCSKPAVSNVVATGTMDNTSKNKKKN